MSRTPNKTTPNKNINTPIIKNNNKEFIYPLNSNKKLL